MKKSKDGIIEFNEKYHTYSNGVINLESITKYISKYKGFFDLDLIAGNYAIKNNLLKEDVINMWKEKGKRSCEVGTYIHSIFEDYILKKDHVYQDYPKVDVARKIKLELFSSKRLIPLETEYIVYNDKYAGQIDCIAKNKKGEHFIFDWKTNNKIDFSSFGGKKMKTPYNHLMDCNFIHYSLQLSCYKEMCKEYDINKCYIVHLEENSYSIIETKNISVNLN